MTALRRWSSFEPSRPVRPWLFGIAFRVNADFRARARHRGEQLEVPEMIGTEQSPETVVANRQRSALLEKALARLDETKRATFLLHFGEGLSPAEVAEALEVPLATVYTRLRTARLELTEALASLEGRHD